jgi:hypothetical protein
MSGGIHAPEVFPPEKELIMKLLLVAALFVASWGISYANLETTFDLPGGAKIEAYARR